MMSNRPQIDDVANTQQVARYLQWNGDMLQHLDRCLDDLKELVRAGVARDTSQADLMDEHMDFHRAIDEHRSAQNAVWVSQKKVLVGAAGVGAIVAELAAKVVGFVK